MDMESVLAPIASLLVFAMVNQGAIMNILLALGLPTRQYLKIL